MSCPTYISTLYRAPYSHEDFSSEHAQRSWSSSTVIVHLSAPYVTTGLTKGFRSFILQFFRFH